jgi:hypothetical protein
MLHSIREAISAGSTEKFDGPVEGDETYVGGLEKFKHKSRRQHKVNGGIGKYIVMGVLGRSTHAKKSKIKVDIVYDTTYKSNMKQLCMGVYLGLCFGE